MLLMCGVVIMCYGSVNVARVGNNDGVGVVGVGGGGVVDVFDVDVVVAFIRICVVVDGHGVVVVAAGVVDVAIVGGVVVGVICVWDCCCRCC